LTEKEENELTGKRIGVFGARFLQLISAALAVVGFIWATGDYLTSLFPSGSVVTPLSVLMMLYGFIGTVAFEGLVRFLTRKK
jgi:hypothetical protein